jgi:[acyl-carrier-protein] S-malonyltransferase
MSLAFLFPGQGSQAVGMGSALADAFPAARLVFEEVDDALGRKLSKLMWEGPEADLTLTHNAQPALMAVSMAVVRVLKADFGIDVTRAAFVAGHSLGEYSALAAGEAFSLAAAARLLRLRGEAMQRAVPVGEGAMASLIGPKADLELAEAAAAAGSAVGVCVVANDNNVGNVVISGAAAAVALAIEKAKALGAGHLAERVRAVPLPADGARGRGDGQGVGGHPDPGAPRAGGGQCDRPADSGRGPYPRSSGAAGDGPGALAREHGVAGRGGRGDSFRRAWVRQGADRDRQALRARSRGHGLERPGGPGSLRQRPVSKGPPKDAFARQGLSFSLLPAKAG